MPYIPSKIPKYREIRDFGNKYREKPGDHYETSRKKSGGYFLKTLALKTKKYILQ